MTFGQVTCNITRRHHRGASHTSHFVDVSLLCRPQTEHVQVPDDFAWLCAPAPQPVNPLLTTVLGAGFPPGRGVSHTSHFVDVALLLHIQTLQVHSSKAVVGFAAPAPHPVNPVSVVIEAGFAAGLGVSQTSHFVDVALLLHMHVVHSHILSAIFGATPVPHPVNAVDGAVDAEAAGAAGIAGSLKVNVNVGNLSMGVARDCWRDSGEMSLLRSGVLANDLNVFTGRALASSFLTMSSGVSVVGDDGALVDCLDCLDTADCSTGDGAENGSDILFVFSGSAELAIVLEMISKAENFDGGGCLGVVVSSDEVSGFLIGLFARANIELIWGCIFGSDAFCFAGLLEDASSTCIRLSASSDSLELAAGLGDVLRERCAEFSSCLSQSTNMPYLVLLFRIYARFDQFEIGHFRSIRSRGNQASSWPWFETDPGTAGRRSCTRRKF